MVLGTFKTVFLCHWIGRKKPTTEMRLVLVGPTTVNVEEETGEQKGGEDRRREGVVTMKGGGTGMKELLERLSCV